MRDVMQDSIVNMDAYTLIFLFTAFRHISLFHCNHLILIQQTMATDPKAFWSQKKHIVQ